VASSIPRRLNSFTSATGDSVCLIHQANYLLDRQIRRLEQDFVKEGGIRERMTRARLQYRNRISQPRKSP
jgi:four helix bundle suffix protein